MIQQDEGYHINLQISIIYNSIQQHWAIKTLNREKILFTVASKKRIKYSGINLTKVAQDIHWKL